MLGQRTCMAARRPLVDPVRSLVGRSTRIVHGSELPIHRLGVKSDISSLEKPEERSGTCHRNSPLLAKVAKFHCDSVLLALFAIEIYRFFKGRFLLRVLQI